MGQYSEDLINGSDIFNDVNKISRKKCAYSIRIINNQTKEEVWSNNVLATCSKNAQTEFRKKYTDVRRKYYQGYVLLIYKI